MTSKQKGSGQEKLFTFAKMEVGWLRKVIGWGNLDLTAK